MTHRFVADTDFTAHDLRAPGAGNPFESAAYRAARGALGWEAWLLGAAGDEAPAYECTAFLRRGRIGGMLEIPSLRIAVPQPEFWSGLLRFCSRNGLTHLVCNSYAAPEVSIPRLAGERVRTPRREWVLDLVSTDPWELLAENMRRRIRRARKRGYELHRGDGYAAVEAHAALVHDALARRAARGEVADGGEALVVWRALVDHGAAEIYQASRDGVAHSSILVLRNTHIGYYMSAGTDGAGRDAGASHFLVYETARLLAAQGATLFNLGGAESWNTGLARFKAGFGAREIPLEAAEFTLGNPLQRAVSSAAAFCRGLGYRLTRSRAGVARTASNRIRGDHE